MSKNVQISVLSTLKNVKKGCDLRSLCSNVQKRNSKAKLNHIMKVLHRCMSGGYVSQLRGRFFLNDGDHLNKNKKKQHRTKCASRRKRAGTKKIVKRQESKGGASNEKLVELKDNEEPSVHEASRHVDPPKPSLKRPFCTSTSIKFPHLK